MLQDEWDVGNEEADFGIKNLLSWQNILSNRYRRKMSQSRRIFSWRNQSYYLPFCVKQMETIPRGNKQSAT